MTMYVVGGGVAGLAAAWELRRAGASVTVLESERRPGGVVVTERREGFVMEGGPDSFLASEPEIPAVARDLGIAERMIAQAARGSAVWTDGKFTPLEEGRAAELLGIEASGADVAQGLRSFAGGMLELVEGLVARLGDAVRPGRGVTGLSPAPGGWRLALTGGSALEAEAVVLAVPAYTAGRMLESVGVHGARVLEDAVYTPSVTVSLAYGEDQLATPLDGTGFVVASGGREPVGAAVRACTFASRKFAGRAPAGHVLVRAFLAGSGGDASGVAHAGLAAILGIAGAPRWSRAFHWARALPRYPATYAHALALVRRRLERLPPLALAGSGFDGRSVSACVKSGTEAARVILHRVASVRG